MLLYSTLEGRSSDQTLALWDRLILFQAPIDVLPLVLELLAQSFFCNIGGLL